VQATWATCRKATGTISKTPESTISRCSSLNNGTYQSISITAWMAGTPDLLLATNFGVPESVFEEMPGDAVIMPEQD
jgi:oxalate decarboxylase